MAEKNPPVINVPSDENDNKKKRKASQAWKHFHKLNPSGTEIYLRAQCKYCPTIYKADPIKHGTNSMKRHLKDCKNFPGRSGPMDNYTISYNGDGPDGGLKATMIHKFDPKYIRDCLTEWIICDEQPFRTVDSDKFRKLCHAMEPRFSVPSRVTVARDMFKMYNVEKQKLTTSLAGAIGRVSLTTDTWTSANNQNYMCVTVHFIDRNWILHKRIISFKLIEDHRGESIGKALETVLEEWGIKKILCITVDNARSNNLAIEWVTKYGSNHVLGGEHIHVRCFAHVVNIMVKYGLTKCVDSIERIRMAVKYVTRTPKREKKFLECVKAVGITCTKGLRYDVVTRWNSVYFMLDAAEKYEKAFDRLAYEDDAYRNIFVDTHVECQPRNDDWINARILIPFLKPFYEATNLLSGTSYVTANRYFSQFCSIGNQLRTVIESNKYETRDENGNGIGSDIHDIAFEMKVKYDDYFGSSLKVNPLLYIALVLDPRSKLSKVRIGMKLAYGSMKIDETIYKKCLTLLKRMFEEYKLSFETSEVATTTSIPVNSSSDQIVSESGTFELWDTESNPNEYVMHDKSELDRYLDEFLEKPERDFDILAWWKGNEGRFRIVASMARDIFAIPASSVASESAFSTGGRVINNRRCSLKPRTVEALICTQSWLNNVSSIDSGDIVFDLDEETAAQIEVVAMEELDGIEATTTQATLTVT